MIRRRALRPRPKADANSCSLAARFFNQGFGLRRPGDGQFARVEETDLSEHTGLIPIDMLVGDFAPLKFHHDDMRAPKLNCGPSDRSLAGAQKGYTSVFQTRGLFRPKGN